MSSWERKPPRQCAGGTSPMAAARSKPDMSHTVKGGQSRPSRHAANAYRTRRSVNDPQCKECAESPRGDAGHAVDGEGPHLLGPPVEGGDPAGVDRQRLDEPARHAGRPRRRTRSRPDAARGGVPEQGQRRWPGRSPPARAAPRGPPGGRLARRACAASSAARSAWTAPSSAGRARRRRQRGDRPGPRCAAACGARGAPGRRPRRPATRRPARGPSSAASTARSRAAPARPARSAPAGAAAGRRCAGRRAARRARPRRRPRT